MVRIKKVLEWLDAYAPFRFAASWDNCGLLVGDPEAFVERILVALDVGSGVLAEAEETGCQCVVTHHPLLLRPLSSVRADVFPGSLVIRAIRSGINLVAAHTNLDAACGGTNDILSGMLSLEEVEPLEVDGAMAGEESYKGIGCVGYMAHEMTLDGLVDRLQNLFGEIGIRVIGERETRVRKVALCTGSGSGLMKLALARGAGAYITGDVKYHDAQWAGEVGLAVVDIGHFASERPIVEPLAAYLRDCSKRDGYRMDVVVSNRERDPFRFNCRRKAEETHIA